MPTILSDLLSCACPADGRVRASWLLLRALPTLGAREGPPVIPQSSRGVHPMSSPQTEENEPQNAEAEAATETAPKAEKKPRPVPKPGSFKVPTPAAVAAHVSHPVLVPVTSDVSDEDLAAA